MTDRHGIPQLTTEAYRHWIAALQMDLCPCCGEDLIPSTQSVCWGCERWLADRESMFDNTACPEIH
jgi:hypothetical protein